MRPKEKYWQGPFFTRMPYFHQMKASLVRVMTTTTTMMERARAPRMALQERLAVQYNCDSAVTNHDALNV
jgi:hypothetical protein